MDRELCNACLNRDSDECLRFKLEEISSTEIVQSDNPNETEYQKNIICREFNKLVVEAKANGCLNANNIRNDFIGDFKPR